jgi:Zn-dependent M28 family amino/carboxypeptidase
MTVFGEEKGLMGSSYYARHPVVPLEKTIANINLEVVGRTDGSEGLEKGRAALTGYDYSTVGKTLKKAGSLVGVDVYHHDRFGDQFFNRSDNWVFAAAGIPSHSICSVFTYPDYHRVTDQWERIDYPNLEKLVRTVALGLIILAENPVEPGWNEANPKTAPHLEAWRKLKKL